MSFANKLENTYLNILRYIILAVATLALIGVLITGIMALFAYMSPEPGAHTPLNFEQSSVNKKNIALDVFGNEQSNAKSEQKKEKAQEPQVRTEDKPQTFFRESAEKVNNSLLSYMQVVFNRTVDPQRTLNFVLNFPNSNRIPDDPEIRKFYWNTLVSLSSELEKRAVEDAKLPDEKKVDVDKLLNWHAGKVKNAIRQFDKENEDLQAKAYKKRADYAAKKASAPFLLAAAGSALFVFISVVLTFLMVKIERNLRPLQQIADAQKQ